MCSAHQLLEEQIQALFHISNSSVNFKYFNSTCAGYSRYDNGKSTQSFSSNATFHIKT